MQFDSIRRVLESIDPAASHGTGAPPDISEVYAPSGHESALDPERALVIGDRGMGKTFWTWSLAGDASRAYLSDVFPRLGLSQCQVRVGFAGEDMGPEGSISTEVFDELQGRHNHSAELIWRAVILRAAYLSVGKPLPAATLVELLKWADADTERFQLALRSIDDEVSSARRKVVVLFDALDRLGSNWDVIRLRTIALIRVALALRSYRALKVKIFMRSDQAADGALFAFPDASKVFGARVDLFWERRDLFGLAYSRIARSQESRADFAELLTSTCGLALSSDALPDALKHDESLQASVFSALAGPYMGSDWRKGKTYAWLHNHLADAHGRVSPRSFMSALRSAAAARPIPIDKLFEPKGLQRGVQDASSLRVAQLEEEFPWIKDALRPLADLRVPSTKELLISRWDEEQTPIVIARSAQTGSFLPPIEFGTDAPSATADALLEALRRIGVAEVRPDGRINMPDIYRVAARLLRKGGIRPTR